MKRLWGTSFAVSLGLLSSLAIAGTAYAQEEDDDLTPPRHTPSPTPPNVEEMLVTGSYIKGLSAENLASPMQSISRSDILDIGAFRLEDIVNNLTINSGSQNNPDAFTQNFTTGTSNLNLRGLGVASTLVLLNGRRQTYSAFTTDKGENFVDLSSLVPLIAVERLEVLKDGAASLYGSDAVAGVANFITRNNFEGAEIEIESLSGDKQGDLKLGAIFGTGNDTTHFMAAIGYLDRDGLGTNEKRLSNVEDDTSRAGFPGTFLLPFAPVPAADAFSWNLAYNAQSPAFTFGGQQVADFFEALLPGGAPVPGSNPPAFADVDCSNLAAQDDTTLPPAPTPLPSPVGPCQFDFGSFFSLVPDEERTQLYTTLSHKFSDSLEWFLEAAYAEVKAERRNSPSFPITTTPVICGDGPAVFDALNLDGMPYTCNTGPNAVGAHPDNPYGAATLFVGRILGSGTESLISHHDSETQRLATGLSGSFGKGWSWDIDYTDSSNRFLLQARDTLATEFQLALFGLGGDECSGDAADAGDASAGCSFFNPFGSSLTGTGTVNTPEIYDYITAPVIIDAEAKLQTITAITSGNLFSMRGGDAALAVGLQSRKESLDYDYDDNSNAENFIFFSGNPDFDGERTIKAVFTELAIPVTDIFDIQLSVRSEDYEDAGKSTDPKLSAVVRIPVNLTLRGSIGTSFRAPSLFQQSGVQTTLVEISTPTLGNQFIPVRAQPNPDDPLKPEEADVFNLGASWTSDNEAFNTSIDYWSYDYTNVIIQQNPQAVVDAGLEDQIERNATGIRRVTAYYDNASELQTDGIDLAARYNWSGDVATYQLGMELTKVMSYDIEDPQAGAIDGLGQRNFTNFSTSMPELRANLHFLWSLGGHAFNVFARHIDSYNNDQLDNFGQPRNQTIEAHTTFDLQYSYRFENWADDEMTIMIGGINVTDENPPHVATNGGYDSKIHDPRGALYYVKLNVPLF
jgi:iron complex outermembrane recepter protein